ncbi:MAG: hypothetical protein ACREMB_27425 [Candidatus Rokuibacteriota bacterium]
MATAGATETLVLTDDKGNYYVLPRQLIENARVTDEQKKRELQESVQGETTGFSSFGTSVQAFRFGGTTLRPLGNCNCSWNFDQIGRIR